MIIGTCVGVWTPAVGDPDLLAWLTVAAYLGTAILTWRARGAAIRARTSGAVLDSATFWALLSSGLVALGANKQLDLQSAVTELGRTIVHGMGWYQHRHALQFGFFVALFLFVLAFSAWLGVLARREIRRVLLALFGWIVLSAFVATRAASFHHVDRFLGTGGVAEIGGATLELVGIALIGVGAYLYRRPPPTV